MLPRRTVFVLGAGASCDLGLPSGDQLREKLVRILNRAGHNKAFSYEYIRRSVMSRCHQIAGTNWAQPFQNYLDAAARIESGLPLAVSIDNYLDAHRNDPIMRELGKLAIAAAILDSERNSALNQGNLAPVAGIDRFPANPKLDQSWYLPLMRILTAGQSVEEVRLIFANVAFVVFNYDRCLEQFLINAVMAYFNVTPQVAIECLSQLRVVHPYGRVGYLRWQEQAITAGFGNVDVDLNQIAEGIQTFTESADEGVVDEVRSLVADAETLVFMGYGFLQQNNELLTVQDSRVRRVFATTSGVSDEDVPIVKDQICHVIRKREATTPLEASSSRYARLFIERGYCRSLMDNHRFRMTQPPEPLLNLG